MVIEAICELHGWDVSKAISSIEKMTTITEETRSLASRYSEIKTIELSEIPSFIEGKFSEIEAK